MAHMTSTFTAPWNFFSGVHCTQLTKRNLMTSADWYLHVSATRTVSYLLVQPHKNKSKWNMPGAVSRYLYAYWLTPSGQSNSIIVSGNVNTQEETGLCVTLTHLIWFLELDHTFGQLRAQRRESKTNGTSGTNAVYFWTMTSKEAELSKIYTFISSTSVKLLPVSINSKHPIELIWF